MIVTSYFANHRHLLAEWLNRNYECNIKEF